MPLSRRDLLRLSATGGALLLARPVAALAEPTGALGAIGVADLGAARTSRLFPGTHLVHADLHNHTLLSDGDGDPANAFASMRAAGLDVAALTDHTTTGSVAALPCDAVPHEECSSLAGLDEAKWERLRGLADAADEPGAFAAIRGFEWSSPLLGHVNVWFSETWTDPLATGGAGVEGFGQLVAQELPGLGPVVGPPLDGAIRAVPDLAPGMRLLYDWLAADPSRAALGGGADAIAGFNHPGRETGRFGYFGFEPAVRDRIVSMELFNRREDYLFEGLDAGQPSPLSECLDAGWRVGFLGVTDEHGRDWGFPEGKGRSGLWVTDLSRAGVREAMLARRFFATRLSGVRLDVAATPGPAADDPARRVRMGSDLPHAGGPVTFEVDVDRGAGWVGKRLVVSVLRPGRPLPAIAEAVEVAVPAPDEPLPTLTVDLDPADGPWVVVRISDPDAPADRRAAGTPYAGLGEGIAYASPFWLTA